MSFLRFQNRSTTLLLYVYLSGMVAGISRFFPIRLQLTVSSLFLLHFSIYFCNSLCGNFFFFLHFFSTSAYDSGNSFLNSSTFSFVNFTGKPFSESLIMPLRVVEVFFDSLTSTLATSSTPIPDICLMPLNHSFLTRSNATSNDFLTSSVLPGLLFAPLRK